jgi:hypothetical protein
VNVFNTEKTGLVTSFCSIAIRYKLSFKNPVYENIILKAAINWLRTQDKMNDR